MPPVQINTSLLMMREWVLHPSSQQCAHTINTVPYDRLNNCPLGAVNPIFHCTIYAEMMFKTSNVLLLMGWRVATNTTTMSQSLAKSTTGQLWFMWDSYYSVSFNNCLKLFMSKFAASGIMVFGPALNESQMADRADIYTIYMTFFSNCICYKKYCF